MEKHLHIVSFDVPYPPDYGGVIPIFALIKNLKAASVKIHLHCFQFGRDQQPILEEYCHEVRYYERNSGIKGISLRLPYIVSTRRNDELKANLLQDQYPILFEGVHCSLLALHPLFRNRQVAVRIHNVEFIYYRQLYAATSDLFKKAYYFFESKLLKKFESHLAKEIRIVSLSPEDKLIYQRKLRARDVTYLPMPIPFDKVTTNAGKGEYCLYHGNLAVEENEKAVIWLITKVFNDLNIPLLISGKNPSERLKKIAGYSNNIRIKENPSEQEMQDLIQHAQINVLPTFNSTGIKLKLLNALFNGRHCVVNAAMVCATQLVSECHIADDEQEFKSLIRKLYDRPFTEKDIRSRKEILLSVYDNVINTQSLVQWIY